MIADIQSRIDSLSESKKLPEGKPCRCLRKSEGRGEGGLRMGAVRYEAIGREGIPERWSLTETRIDCKPRANSKLFGAGKGVCRRGVDAGFPQTQMTRRICPLPSE